jgi:hypothetical protein
MDNLPIDQVPSLRVRRGIPLAPLAPRLPLQNNHQQGAQPPPLRILSNQQAWDNLLGLINNPQ